MNARCEKILKLLKARKARGITFDDFPRGYRLAARIRELREAGNQIVTAEDHISASKWRARYVLLQECR